MPIPMTNRIDALFSPAVAFRRRRSPSGNPTEGYWYPDLNKDWSLVGQFIEEAGLKPRLGNRIADNELDAITTAASKHGYCIETIGG